MLNTIARLFLMLPLLAFNLILAAYNSSVQEETTSSSDQEGTLAKVESVMVEESNVPTMR